MSAAVVEKGIAVRVLDEPENLYVLLDDDKVVQVKAVPCNPRCGFDYSIGKDSKNILHIGAGKFLELAGGGSILLGT